MLYTADISLIYMSANTLQQHFYHMSRSCIQLGSNHTLVWSLARQVFNNINQLTGDLAAMRRMTDSSSVNLRLASDSAAVRRDSCDLQSASTCMVKNMKHVIRCSLV